MRIVLSTVIVSSVAAILGMATPSHARLHDMQKLWSVDIVKAIHMPTGCVASLEYHDGAFAAAFITDPLCLPKGVAKRPVPGAAHDFHATEPRSRAISTR